MYTRIYVTKCHTVHQVLVGEFIGIIYGILTFYLFKNIFMKK